MKWHPLNLRVGAYRGDLYDRRLAPPSVALAEDVSFNPLSSEGVSALLPACCGLVSLSIADTGWEEGRHTSPLTKRRNPSVEPKVRLQGYGYNPFCSHSSRCLAVLPKGPFRTKNSTAPESVVFCYRRSFTFCTVFLPLFSRKRSISEHSPYRFATAVANLLPVLNLLSVLFLVREGPLGSLTVL